jgi:hypothetical protein
MGRMAVKRPDVVWNALAVCFAHFLFIIIIISDMIRSDYDSGKKSAPYFTSA